LFYGRAFILQKDEYCGQNEPLVRSFEPLNAGKRASKCGQVSHQSDEAIETAIENEVSMAVCDP